MSEKKLEPKEKLFIAEYCNNGFNGTQAALKAGYSKRSAGAISSENLQKPYIKAHIKAYLNEILGKYKDTLEYRIIQQYMVLAFYDTEDILNKDGKIKTKDLKSLGELSKCIKGIYTSYNAKGQKQVKVELYNRESALEKLAQYMNLLRQSVDIDIKGSMFEKMSELFFKKE